MIVVGLLFGLLMCMVPIAILVLIISAVVKRNKEDKGNFEETIRNIYVYIILIVTLVAIIAGIIGTFRIGLDVVLPEKNAYSNSYTNEQKEKNENMIELFTTLSLVISVTPVFIYHNKLVKKNKVSKIDEKTNEA